MDSLLVDLMNFYAKLGEVLQSSNRDCKGCGECCKKVSMLRVYPLEQENIRRYVHNKPSFRKFQDFISDSAIEIWGTEGQCPFQNGNLCIIYPVRPYYCRVYGHYDYQGKSLLDGCVYQGHAVIYNHREELPLIDEFDQLMDALPPFC